ncbi:hypothetical protein DL771_009838 [Monosporascus sp. 5C6A]|nr:hypothetical protein DL771_009838 [Monosporascus sp. 5C6A]
MLAVVPLASLLLPSVSGIKLWNSPGDIPTSVPARCRAPLTQNITCELLVKPDNAANGEIVPGGALDEFCGSTCRSSLETFQKNIASGCGNTYYALWKNSNLTQSPKVLADGFVWAHTLACLSDANGYCLAELHAGNKTECSECALKYGAVMVSSDYGRGKVAVDDFEKMLSTCKASPSDYPWTHTSRPPAPTTPGEPTPTPRPCRGTTYTVAQGDTCKSISKANSVAIDRLIYDNGLDYLCNSLTVGTKLCIGDSCNLHTVESGETCQSIVQGRGFNLVQLKSWNPTLENMCESSMNQTLEDIVGRSICVSPPGIDDFPTKITESRRPIATLDNPWFTEWETGVVVTDPTDGVGTWTRPWDPDFTPPPEQIIINDPKWDEAREWTKYCWITEDDWAHGYDPEDDSMVPPACSNLYEKYCLYTTGMPSPTPMTRFPAMCTPDRSDYNPEPIPDPVPTPRPVQEGMTEGCSKFHKVKSGDTCDKVTKANNVTLADFYKWNPSVGTDCRNLQLDVYVCVGYDERMIPMPQPTPME